MDDGAGTSTPTRTVARPRRPLRRAVRQWNELLAAGRRRWGRLPGRQQWMSFLKNLAWVVPLTILIWIWAERYQVTREPAIIRVAVVSTDPNRLVELRSPEEGVIQADLSGAKSRVDRLRDELKAHVENPAVRVEVDGALAAGQTHRLSTLQALRDLPIFRDVGVTLSNCQPASLQVFVDEYIEVEATVVAPPDLAILDGPAIFDPPTVKARGPRSVMQAAPRQVVAEVSAALFPQLREAGEHKLQEVRLTRRGALAEERVTLARGTVAATLKVRPADARYVMPFVPVFVVAPGPVLEKYDVKYTPTIPNVTVIGRQEAIEAIQREDFTPKPKALLELSRDDATPGTRTRRLRFDLPAGVQVGPQDANRQIEFELVERPK